MYNQTEAVLAQYEMEIHQITKGRGTYICDTDKGMKLLVSFRGSKERGEFLKSFLAELKSKGFPVEQIDANLNMEAVTKDEVTGERFIIKNQINGTELDTGRFSEMEEAVKLLAHYHETAAKVQLEVPEKMKNSAASVVESRRRHYRELVKVRNYIRARKKKNEFEQIFMKSYEPMLATAEQSITILEQQEQKDPECLICHGDYNQHNILCRNGEWYIIHFENIMYSWAVSDLANFIRKMLEKNNWETESGMRLIQLYDRNRPLGKDGYLQLYGLLLFPEKFWKITNHYMNSHKAWISGRDIEKLKKVIEQESKRLNFMENLFSFLQ